MDFTLPTQERSLFAKGPMVLFQWKYTEEWPIEYVSVNVGKVLGYQVDEVVEKGLKGLIDPQDVAQVETEIQAKSGVHTQEFAHEPFRFLSKGGEPIWLLAHTAVFREESGQISHCHSYVLDISDRRRAELKLKESEARYHQIFETNLAVKLIIDPANGRIVEANQAAARFYGYPLKALTQMKISDINMLSKEEVSMEMERAKSEERLFFNFKHRLQSGEVRDVEVYSGPLQSSDGMLLFSIIYDVTERLRAEELLQSSHQELADALIALEQTQVQMVQRERLAAVGQLTAGIAHDFNNILTGILGFAELLQLSPELPPHSKKDIESIIQSGERGALLIRQLLDFSRKSSQVQKPLKFDDFLVELVAFLTRMLPSHIQLQYESSEGDFWLCGDSNHLHQALTNLAINARDAMPTGGTLKLALSRVSLQEDHGCVICHQTLCGDWIHLEISDTGTGMSEEVLLQIFEPFFTTKPVGKGSGLGLSQVAGIISQHQGHLQVHSTPGVGTTFRCFFPPSQASQVDKVRPVDDQIIHGNGETILLVEDDSTVSAVLCIMLHNLGYKVLNATCGKEGLALFHQHQSEIALTLSDVMMPGLDGMALFRALKALNPQHKVILMSGYPLGPKDILELEGKAVDWVQKPISLAELSQLLHRNLCR